MENVMLQLDKISASEAASYQDADPHFTYTSYTTMLPLNDPQLIQFRDHLVDQDVLDADTGELRKYLIVDDPEMHSMDGHWQWICTRMRGT
jgi:hypothetical protein